MVRFRAGGEVELPARVEGSFVTLEAPGGPVRLALGDVATIEPRMTPEQLWPALRKDALRSGAAGRFAAACWALDHALTDEAGAMFRLASRADPTSDRYARVPAVLDALQAPCPDPDAERYHWALQRGLRPARSAHVLLLHQHDAGEARERLDLLERVVTTYHAAFAARGRTLRLPAQKLVAIWFAGHEDYRRFLREEGATAFLGTQGYYHPTRRVVVTFDLRCLERFRRGAEPPRDRAGLLRDQERRALEIGTAVHELLHLLIAESGLAGRHEDFPVWLHEGLAMQFEPARGGRWAGPAGVNTIRLPHWNGLPEAPPLAPLLQDAGFGRGVRANRYAAAWALVAFLSREKPDEFAAFLDLLRVPSGPLPPGRDRVTAVFVSAFGSDLNAIEIQWHAWMRSTESGKASGD
jgi:hypothetical protein